MQLTLVMQSIVWPVKLGLYIDKLPRAACLGIYIELYLVLLSLIVPGYI